MHYAGMAAARFIGTASSDNPLPALQSGLIANAVLFQCGWFACVLGGDSPWLLVGLAVLAIHLLWISSWAQDGALIISVILAGTALDTLLRAAGLFMPMMRELAASAHVPIIDLEALSRAWGYGSYRLLVIGFTTGRTGTP